MCTNKKNHTHRNFIHVILICWSNTARAELYYLFVPFVRLPCKREVIHLYAPLTTSSNCDAVYCVLCLNTKFLVHAFHVWGTQEILKMVLKDFNRWRDLYKTSSYHPKVYKYHECMPNRASTRLYFK